MKLTTEQKETNRIAKKKQNAINKYLVEKEIERNQNPVKQMTITVEWKKSKTWGNCPRAYAEISFHSGDWKRTDAKYYASGYGYDKESTVIAEIFNEFLKYKLWAKSLGDFVRNDHSWKSEGCSPYGVRASVYDSEELGIQKEFRRFEGGIGVNCYYDISEFIGGKFELIASGNTFNVYRYTDK